MSNHTPGPWESCAQYVRGPMKDGGFVVAELPVNSGFMEADSRLIAAAPELLEALKEIAAKDYGNPYAKGCADIARAAILKATGEQP